MKTLLLYISFGFCLSLSAQERCLVEDEVIVYVFMLEDCPITQYYIPKLKTLFDNYHPYNIDFIGLFPNKYSKPEKIDSFKHNYQIPFPLKTDYFQKKVQQFKATVTPEVIVYNKTCDEVLYQGRIDNAYSRVGRPRYKISQDELADALESIVRGESIKKKKTEAIGCYISLIKN